LERNYGGEIMDEKDWTCLAAIFDENNLTHASEKLYISQPALTYRIRKLEKELGIKIFVKGKGTVKFTKEGIVLAQYAKKMLAELCKLKDELFEMNQPGTGISKISSGEYFAHTELPNILSSFHQLYSDIKFSISSINPNNILEDLINAESHITIIRSELDWKGPKLLLRKDPICVISKKAISLTDLPKLPRINSVLTNSTKKAIEEWWQKCYSAPPLIGMSAFKSETCIEMVRQNFGYAIYPLSTAQRKQLNDLCVIPVCYTDGTPHELCLFAYYREDCAEIKIVKTFIKFLKHYFAL
jgi:DNA-binding transcriptional LysR family regulator